MALTAVNRYICVVHQRLYNKIFSKKSTLFMVAAEGIIIILSLVSISSPAGFARITLDPRRAMCFTTFKQLKTSQMVSHVFLVFTVAVPLIIICLSYHRQPKRTICGFGLQRSFGRNILELLVYYLMPNKCKKS